MTTLGNRAAERSKRLYFEACIPAALLTTIVLFTQHITASVAVFAITTALLYIKLHSQQTKQPSTHGGRPDTDDGAIWGATLVSMVVFSMASQSPDNICLKIGCAVSLSMSIAYTLHYSKCQRLRGVIIWMVSMLAIGYEHSEDAGEFVFLVTASGLCCGLQYWLTHHCIMQYLPCSFTLAEASVFAQGLSIVFFDLVRIPMASDKDLYGSSWFQMSTLCLECALAGLSLLVFTLNMFSSNGSMSLIWILGHTVVSGTLALLLIYLISEINPTTWVLDLVLSYPSHLVLVIYWIILLCTGVALYRTAVSGKIANSHNKFILHLKRKSYHLLVTLLFIPAQLYGRSLLPIALVVALIGFVVIECIRILDNGLYSTAIDQFLRKFTDYRDAGKVVTSHFYLLLGCALPVWLGGHSDSSNSAVACLSGVLALGTADTAASLVGMRYGRMKWPGDTSKTIEGTLGFVLSLFVAMSSFTRSLSFVNLATCAVLGVVEALTEQNDNLVIPLLMFSLVLVSNWSHLAVAALIMAALHLMPFVVDKSRVAGKSVDLI